MPIRPEVDISVRELRAARLKKNKTLIASLREDPYSRKLLDSCREDAAKGRMAPLRLAHECDLASVTLSPRFAVKQGPSFAPIAKAGAKPLHSLPGLGPDGEPKLRPIDDMTRRDSACSSGHAYACRTFCFVQVRV